MSGLLAAVDTARKRGIDIRSKSKEILYIEGEKDWCEWGLKERTSNDIFEMISENDEDIKFDECGILKVVTRCKSTFVVVCLRRSSIRELNRFVFSQLIIIFIHLHLKHHPLPSKMIVSFNSKISNNSI